MYTAANRQEVIGQEVIGQPGQCLTGAELRYLVALADGSTPQEIEDGLGLDRCQARTLEGGLLGKLAARNRAHIITRGFTLGVLIPRALCCLLAFFAAIEADHLDAARTRAGRRHRDAPSYGRMVRATSASAGARPFV